MEEPTEQQTASKSNKKVGTPGISGANWREGDFRGVEIMGVACDSSAEMAGLRSGCVIVEVNRRKVRSTQDLAAILAENEPGARLTIGYLFTSNLGWMPKEAVAILTAE